MPFFYERFLRMNVNEIRDRILDISHNEIAPDTQLKEKSLSWLNSAYHEIVSLCLPFLERYLETLQTLTVVNGKAELPNNVFRITSVISKKTGKALLQKTKAEMSLLENSGKLQLLEGCYTIEGRELYVPALKDGELDLIYFKQVEDLVENGAADSLILPAQHHHVLVWGGLVWSSIFERGFSTQGDIKTFQTKWDEAKREVKLSLSNQPSKNFKVQPYDLFN